MELFTFIIITGLTLILSKAISISAKQLQVKIIQLEEKCEHNLPTLLVNMTHHLIGCGHHMITRGQFNPARTLPVRRLGIKALK